MENAYRIRSVKESDAAALLAYTKIVGSESYYLSFGKEGIPLDVQAEAKFIQDHLKDGRNAMWCAVYNDEIIALCSFDAETNKRMAHRASIGISVKKQFWHQGIATAMMHKLMTHAEAIPDITIITLQVICENIHAVQLYERFGFQICGCLHQFFRIGTTDYHAYVMECDLTKRKGQKHDYHTCD